MQGRVSQERQYNQHSSDQQTYDTDREQCKPSEVGRGLESNGLVNDALVESFNVNHDEEDHGGNEDTPDGDAVLEFTW